MSLLGDLGWETIEAIHNRFKIKYYSRLQNMDAHRWPKLLFNATFIVKDHVTNKLRWKWLQSIENILIDNGMDHQFSNMQPYNSRWINVFKGSSKQQSYLKWYNNICDKSSLKLYVMFKTHPYMEDYLKDKLDFEGASLKFKARSNTLPLDSKVRHWDVDNNGKCTVCNNGYEDLEHFLLSCQSLCEIRDNELCKLQSNLRHLGLSYVWNFYTLSGNDIKLCLMLGSNCNTFSPLELDKSYNDIIDEQFDDFCKSYLKRAWSCRKAIKNEQVNVMIGQ
jgi:hypothetical protein